MAREVGRTVVTPSSFFQEYSVRVLKLQTVQDNYNAIKPSDVFRIFKSAKGALLKRT